MEKEKTLESQGETPVLPTKLTTVSQFASFAAGIIISLALLYFGGHVILFIIKSLNERFYIFLTTKQFWYVIYWLLLTLFVYRSIYLAGFCTVEKNHHAVISVFDKRVRYKLKEGKHWLPAGIISAEQIDMRLKNITWEIKFLSKDKIMLVCNIVLQYMVHGELEYISTQPGVAQDGLKEVGEATVSAYGGESDFETAINDPESSTKLKELFESALEQIEGHGLYLAPWGIIVKQVIAGQILPADPQIIKLISDIKAEDFQKQAEEKNTDTAITMIERLVKAGMTIEQARVFYQKERGISTEEFVFTSNSEVTGFEKAQAMRMTGKDTPKEE